MNWCIQDLWCFPILARLSSRYEDLLNLRAAARDAIVAAVSHPQYKLRWAPPEKKDELRSRAYLCGISFKFSE